MERRAIHRRTAARFALVALLVGVAGFAEVGATVGVPDSVPSFNESPGCDGLNGIRGPFAAQSGILPAHEPIYGPWGDFFGRTRVHVENQLVAVKMPAPGAEKTVMVHQRALAAFQQVVANLAAEAAAGNTYTIRSDTWSYNPTTIPPGRTLSFHAIGAAIDVNSSTNPYRADNVLITDMPDWFVDAWRDAGWCWGGDWQSIKDPMHFSWKGPLHQPGYVMPPPQPPLVAKASFTDHRSLPVAFDAPPEGARHAIADMDRDGAVDVVRVVPDSDGKRTVLIAEARWWYGSVKPMGTTKTAVSDPAAPMSVVDMTRDGRPDLVYVLDDEGTVALEVFEFTGGGTMPGMILTTSIPVEANDRYLLADFDRDGYTDVFVIRQGDPALVEVWTGPGYSSTALTAHLAVASNQALALGDRNVDGKPDLFALADDGTLVIHTAASGYTATETIATGLDPAGKGLFVADLDGDGYGDLLLVDAGGATVMRRGGQSTHPPGVWFVIHTHAVSRLAGANRFATAATVSAVTHPSPAGVDTVLIATGRDYPDALAGAAVAGWTNAPLLLVDNGSIPVATATELARLNPSQIIILGGPAAIATTVESALSAYAATTTRLAGANRFETAVAISQYTFSDPDAVTEVIVATGDAFPDALAGAAVAPRLGAPVLLTGHATIPAVTRQEIERLAPDVIRVLGGPAAVSDAVVAELGTLAPVHRIAGANRYETAVEVSREVFDHAERVYLATGLDFADALTGSTAAAAREAPLLLVPGTTLPAIVAQEILRLDAKTVFILGGTAAVSPSVATAASLVGL